MSLIKTGIAFCAQHTVFPSAHTLRFTFCLTNGRERESSICAKTEAWTLFSIFSPEGVRETSSQSETCEKTAPSLSYSLKND